MPQTASPFATVTASHSASQDFPTLGEMCIRDRLYNALRDANISVEAFEQSISSERVYRHCGITRTCLLYTSSLYCYGFILLSMICMDMVV